MLEQKVKIFSENLAREVGRRKFLKQAGTTIFGGMAALAAGQMTLGSASAAERKPIYTRPQCAPPGPFCNLDGVNEPNGCHGGSCFQHRHQGQVVQCRVYYIYQAGCWTTPVSGGYWVCCDCECFNSGGTRVATCGCAQFSTQPYPRPDGPGDGADS
jgi:hypothetical protein